MTAPANSQIPPTQQTPDQQTDPTQGVSNPPYNGNVTSTTPPVQENGLATNNQVGTTAPQTTQPQVSAMAGQASNMIPAPTSALQAPQPVNPLWARVKATAASIGQEVTGGTQYKTTIDSTTGATTRTELPPSGRHIGLALAMELLAGGLSGMAPHGPGAVGQAAQAGLQEGEKIAQARNAAQDKQDKQAQQDIANQQAVLRNNLQTRQLAMSLGRQSLEDATENVKADSDAWESAQENPSNIYAQGLTHDQAYAQLAKIGVGKAQVLITGVVPRRDPKTGEPLAQMPNGNIVPQGTPGSYSAPDFTYAVVKPDTPVKMTDDNGKVLPQYQSAQNRGFIAVNNPGGTGPADFQTTAKQQQTALRGSQNADVLFQEAQSVNPSLSSSAFDSALKSDPTVRNGLSIYQQVLNQGGSHADAMNTLRQSKFAGAAGVINGFYGGKTNTDALDLQASNTARDNTWARGTFNGVADAENALQSNRPDVKAKAKAFINTVQQTEAQGKQLNAAGETQGKLAGQNQATQTLGTGPNPSSTLVGDVDPVALAKQIQITEWGSKPVQNNNPGNIRSNGGAGALIKYPTLQAGFDALVAENKANAKLSLSDYADKRTPPDDGTNPLLKGNPASGVLGQQWAKGLGITARAEAQPASYVPAAPGKGGIAFNAEGATPAAKSLEESVDRIHAGITTPDKERSQSRGDAGYKANQALMTRFSEKYPGESLQVYEQYDKDSKNTNVQTSLRSARTLFGTHGSDGTFDTYERALAKIPTGVPLEAALAQPHLYNLGNEELAALQSIGTDVPLELQQFMASGGHQTDKTLSVAEAAINPASTSGQIQAQLRIIRTAAKERLSGIVGDNPYIKTNAANINDPTSRGASVRKSGNQQVQALPQKGATQSYGGFTFIFDGSQWNKQKAGQ